MSMERAAGPKTELVGVSGRMQKAIEDQIAALAEGLGDCLQGARDADLSDPYKNLRSCEREDAVKIVSATAELLQAIARLKGGFQHDYRIVRIGPESEALAAARIGPESEAPPVVQTSRKWPSPEGYDEETYPRLSEDEADALSDDDYKAYARMIYSLPPHSSREGKQGERPSPPPLENRGSNKDASES